MKNQFENENFILYAPNSLHKLAKDTEPILANSLKKYKELFNINNFRKIQINYFDNINNFREYIYSLRKERNSLPKYATGTFDKGMINGYIDPQKIQDKITYHKKIYLASHELFHIMYKELIWEKNKQERIIWFDEGMAQFFSEEKKEQEENFINWFKEVKQNTKIIPNLNDLSHGKTFKNENYSGYNLSLIAVKYLYEKLGKENFKKLMHNNNQIKEYGKTILKEAINHYNNI